VTSQHKVFKKIACITHSFHAKTKSANIYMDELFGSAQHTVDYYYISDWALSPEAYDLKEDLIGYDVVFIIQLISIKILQKIKCDRIIFIPMYDFSLSWNVFKWLECVGVKILSPSRKLHDIASQYGLHSHYIKYYPKPLAFCPGDVRKIFLWQRTNTININMVLEVLRAFQIDRAYIQNTVDPDYASITPNEESIARCQFTYLGWFEDKQKYWDLMREIGLYIAPRMQEGGASAFIDAMSMGKVVLAHDDATMNEYITHGQTGLLYNASSPQPLDIESFDLAEIQENAYQSVHDGWVSWRNSIPEIMAFIEGGNINHVPHSIDTPLYKMQTALCQEYATLETTLETKHHHLMEAFQKLEAIQDDMWYQFGRLSKKRKVLKLVRMFFLFCSRAIVAYMTRVFGNRLADF
jgi:hypothetical protein